MTKDGREWAECRYCTVQLLKKNLERHEKKCFTTYGIPAELQNGKRMTTPRLIWTASWALSLSSIICYSIFLNQELFRGKFLIQIIVAWFLGYCIVNSIYILWNTILTIIGLKYCVRFEKRRPTGWKFAFVRRKGGAEISEGWDDSIGLRIIGMCVFILSIVAVIVGPNQSIIIGIIPVLGLVFVLAFGYNISQKGYSFQAESKFEATIYTIGIITAIVYSFVLLSNLWKLMSTYTSLAFILFTLALLFIIEHRKVAKEGRKYWYGHILPSGIIILTIIAQEMQIISQHIHIVTAITLGVIVGVFRKHIIYSTRDMWIAVLQGKQGEGSSSNIEITASNYIKNSIVENPARGIRRHYQNDDMQFQIAEDINSPSVNLQILINPVNNSTPCSICSWNKSLGDIYCPNCGH